MIPRSLLPFLVAGALVGHLAACSFLPETVESVPAREGGVALPLRSWIAEGAARPEAIAACFAEGCTPRVAVGVFTATGAQARELSTVLGDPKQLVRYLAEGDARDTSAQRRAVRSVAAAEPVTEGPARGFLLRLARADGTRAAHAAALGRPSGETLRLVIAVADSPDAALRVAREAIAAR